jgi:hypothetical protein
MPNRIYEIRDVAFNALAALMAIVASLVLECVRRWASKAKPRIDT